MKIRIKRSQGVALSSIDASKGAIIKPPEYDF
jgi:hypothetical protein